MVRFPFGLKWRLLLLVSSLVTGMVVLVSFYVGTKQDQVLLENSLKSAERETKSAAFLLARAILDQNDLALSDTLKNLSFVPGFVYAHLVSREKVSYFSFFEEGIDPQMADFLKAKGEEYLSQVFADQEKDYSLERFSSPTSRDAQYYCLTRLIYHPFRSGKELLGGLQLIFADDFIRQARKENERALVTAALILWILGLGVSLLIAHYMVKPIQILSEGVQKVGSGDLDLQLPDLGRHEIGLLGKQFNLMTQSLKEARKERESQIILQEQIRQAQEIQEGMNPSIFLRTPFYEIKGFTRAAKGVGGDYFDFEELPQKQLALIISDVSGKSISASLVMVLIKTVVTTYLRLYEDIRPDKIVSTINRVLCSQAHVDKFATILFCIYDPLTRELVFTNAGHGPLFLYRKRKEVCTITKLEGLPVGLDSTTSYHLGRLSLEQGDILALYSDGITEAWTVDKKPFGLHRLREKILNYAHLNAKEIVERIVADIDHYTAGAEQHDDMTLVIMKVR
ncbi:MAG: SpoIIE family protein phosphatase [Leptospiraceae bacterium]|nr:SpoIIE family protein phosphatase [Leptospiraceae bacterium]MDW8306620.1 SpoIIE family protein phosphatase [Leptospiraceae bacterium]